MGWLRGLMAVLSAFAGIRKGRAVERDQRIKPWQLALAVFVAVAGLLTMLLCLALWATSLR